MNQKIGTGIGTIIISIIAITIGAFIWQYEKGQPTNEMQNSQTFPRSGKNQPERPQIVGGPCEYEKVPGTCRILSLSEDGTAKFNFVATGTLPNNPLAENLNGEHSDTLNILNLQNLSIKAGDKINCEASIETKGTCTPVIYKLLKDTIAPMEEWRTYRNDKLGIEFKIPQMASDRGDGIGDKVNVIENGNIAWIVTENASQFKEHIEQINSSQSEYEKVKGVPWAILVNKVKNDSELENFIQKRYGEKCKLGTKKISSQAGVFDVNVKSNGPEGGCFLNWILAIKYYPEKNLVAAWDLGQGPTFLEVNPEENGAAYDMEILNSFKFIK